MNNMEQEPQQNKVEEEEKIVNGIRYRKVNSGYTLRQYYSHSTPEKGPGPGWDFRWKVLEKYGVNEPSELPDDLFYIWEEIEDNQ